MVGLLIDIAPMPSMLYLACDGDSETSIKMVADL